MQKIVRSAGSRFYKRNNRIHTTRHTEKKTFTVKFIRKQNNRRFPSIANSKSLHGRNSTLNSKHSNKIQLFLRIGKHYIYGKRT